MDKDKRGANLLKNEKSPYLLQHAGNPVNWLPWSDEIFELAKKEDKPLLVSIGYSTCHWCHVMERESYEDNETAELMNKLFINVKVDREEHPHVDSLYMKAVQAISGQGGWPLNVFISPDGTPFFGGTYFPPKDAPGMPSFKTILVNVSKAYYENKGRIAELRETLKKNFGGVKAVVADEALAEEAFKRALEFYDGRNGGFGPGMKFPHAMFMRFLLSYYRRTGNEQALSMVLETLDAMARGGIYDHLGGGFHRYTVDEHWAIPHFEKMLYDNALLIDLYSRAFEIKSAPAYKNVVEESICYLLRDMQSPEGGFYSAQDADVEGEEGTSYIWSMDEVKRILGDKRGKAFAACFSITAGGNFEGSNTLRINPASIEAALPDAGELRAMKEALFNQRQKRERPIRDDKVITAWNGLAISALVKAGEVFKRDEWIREATRAAAFIFDTSRDKDGRLTRYSINKVPGAKALLEDAALFGSAILDIYRAAGGEKWRKSADELSAFMKETFYDKERGLFYDTGEAPSGLFIRERDLFDTDVPSGNSAAAGFFLESGRAKGEAGEVDLARKVLNSISSISDEPLYHGYALSVLEAMLAENRGMQGL